jgi:hypothetical protein
VQTIAQAWLVLTLSSSRQCAGGDGRAADGADAGWGPGPGSVADAADKRKLLIGTQAAQSLRALALGILALTSVI